MKFTKLKSLTQFINESASGPRIVVSYTGKYQPFHKGHYDIYRQIVEKFGKENVYITTADLNQSQIGKKDYSDNHVFTFDEKKLIMTKMFGISPNKIVKITNPYAPKELLSQFSDDTAFIAVVGDKDADRLSGKYFEMYEDGKELKGYKEKGYIFLQKNAPTVKLSATEVRNFFRNPENNDKAKEKFFKEIYGKFDAGIFNLINNKLNATNESLDEFVKENLQISYNFKTEQLNCGGAFGHMSHVIDDYTLSFGQIKEIIDLALEGKLENAVEKCVHGDMEIILEKHGRMKIKDVVEQMIVDKVLSYDHTVDKITFNDILDYANNGAETEWIEIQTEDNTVLVTGNHRVYVDGIGDVMAKDLTTEMIIIEI
jgi:cytidyltransferase-like protein